MSKLSQIRHADSGFRHVISSGDFRESERKYSMRESRIGRNAAAQCQAGRRMPMLQSAGHRGNSRGVSFGESKAIARNELRHSGDAQSHASGALPDGRKSVSITGRHRMPKLKQHLVHGLASATLALGASAVQAQFVTITIPPPDLFVDGSHVTGTLTYYNGMEVIDSWDLTVDRPGDNDYHYTPANSSIGYNFNSTQIYLDSTDQRHHITMTFHPSPFDSCNSGHCSPSGVLVTDNDIPTSAVPEPAAAVLMLAGAGALLPRLRRRREGVGGR